MLYVTYLQLVIKKKKTIIHSQINKMSLGAITTN